MYYPRPTDKSAIMQWGSLVYHAVIVHVLFTVPYSLIAFGISFVVPVAIPFDNELSNGEINFDSYFSLWTIVWTTISTIVMIVGSTVTGVADIPSWISRTIGIRIRTADNEMLINEPLFYRAWRTDRKKEGETTGVLVRVKMNNGDVYFGRLYQYEFISEIGESRDLILRDTVLHPGGDESQVIEYSFEDGLGGGALLNTKNISSIVYEYEQSSPSKTV